MMASPPIAEDIASPFDYVLVDEYQDTNALQAEILLQLKPDGRGLTVVGDDAQAIYGFRAATVRNILDFPNHFAPPAAVSARAELPLHPADPRRRQRGHRLASRGVHQEPVLPPALAAAAVARHRATRTSRSTTSSARCWRTARPGLPCAQQAVLFRTAHHSGRLELELGRRNIPFVKFGGLKFVETAHVKDVLAFLRFAENPRDRVAGVSGSAAAARRRPRHGAQGAGRLEPAISTMPRSAGCSRRSPPPSCGRPWSSSCARWRGA